MDDAALNQCLAPLSSAIYDQEKSGVPVQHLGTLWSEIPGIET